MKAEIPKSILQYLQGYVARQRWRALLSGVGWALVIGVGWGLLACGMDRWMGLNAPLRMVLLIIGGIAIVATIVAGMVAAMRKIDWVGVADEIERRNLEF